VLIECEAKINGDYIALRLPLKNNPIVKITVKFNEFAWLRLMVRLYFAWSWLGFK